MTTSTIIDMWKESHGHGDAGQDQQAVRQRFSRGPRPRPGDRRRRVPGAGRPVRLRQDHRAADGRRAGGHQHRRDEDRRPGGQHALAEGPGHRDGVPVLRAVPAHDGGRQHRLRPEDPEDGQGRDRPPGAEGRGHARARDRCWTASPSSSPAVSGSGSPWAGPSSASRRSS